MRDWAKLHADISKSRSFATACNEDPRAGLLFLMMLPRADVLGIVDAHPVIFRGEVCPLLRLTNDELERCLAILQEQDMIVLYRCPKGDRWLWVKHWAKYQEVRWTHVGATTRPLPEGWEPPDGLDDFLREHPGKPLSIAIIKLRENYCSTTVVLQCPRERARETETETEERQRKDSAPPAAAEAAEESATPKKPGPANSPRAQLVQDTWEALGFAGSPPSKKPAIFGAAMKLMDGKTDTVRNELIPWINRNDPSPGDGDSEAGWFLAFVEEKLKCTPGVGWRRELADLRGGNGASAARPTWEGWPADLTAPDLAYRLTAEQLDELARSPDYPNMLLTRYLDGGEVLKVKRLRRQIERANPVEPV